MIRSRMLRVDTFRMERNCPRFADDIFDFIFLRDNGRNIIKTLKFVPKRSIGNASPNGTLKPITAYFTDVYIRQLVSWLIIVFWYCLLQVEFTRVLWILHHWHWRFIDLKWG